MTKKALPNGKKIKPETLAGSSRQVLARGRRQVVQKKELYKEDNVWGGERGPN